MTSSSTSSSMKYTVGDEVRINEKYFINSASEGADPELLNEHREDWAKHSYIGTVKYVSPVSFVSPFPYEVHIGGYDAHSFKEEELDPAIPLDLPSLSTYE